MIQPRLLEWRAVAKTTLIGFAKVQFSSGLIIAEIAVHRCGGRTWAVPPSRPWLENDLLVRDERGRPRYQPIVTFANHGVQSSWSRQVLRALRAVHPELFDEPNILNFDMKPPDHVS